MAGALCGAERQQRNSASASRTARYLAEVGMPATMADAGIAPVAYRADLPQLVRDTVRDASLRTNPRMPLLAGLLATVA